MSEQCMDTLRCDPQDLRQAMSIHTQKITDACRDKDCIEDLRVYLTTGSQALLDSCASARVRCGELLYTYIDVEPVAFDRNHYCIDVTFYYRILADAVVGAGRPAALYGLAVFHKRAVLCGEDSCAHIYRSDTRIGEKDGITRFLANRPTAVVEVTDTNSQNTKPTHILIKSFAINRLITRNFTFFFFTICYIIDRQIENIGERDMANANRQGKKSTENVCTNDNIVFVVREWIYNVGIIALFLILGFLLFSSRKAAVYPNVEEKDLGKIIWLTFFSVTSGAMIIIEFIVAVLYIKYKRNCSKTTIITFSVLVYLLAMFDNVAIEYPASPSLIVLVNFCVITFCVAYALFNSVKKEPTIVIQGDHKTVELRRAISGTENKKLIAVQMYKVRSEHISVNGKDKTRFIVNAGESFTREGHDINSVSSLVYELDRADVDEFTTILKSYHLVEQFGNDETRKKLIESIDEQIGLLGDRLKSIDEQKREVIKEDCCIARVLVMYMSFKRILVPDPTVSETRADYIGEISLNDGDLKLSVDTERKLFTQVRTGLLAAALLGIDSRYVFHYRKDGLKQGRKYCASQLRCEERYSEGVISSQEMDICLFTVDENAHAAIPPYVFTSITKREALIQDVLNKLKKEDEHNE